MIEFRLLGPLEVVRGGAPIALGGRRRRAVLAALLLDAGRVVSIDRLAEDLYGGEAPATAATQIHRLVSELRRLLPEARLETRSPGYLLGVAPDELDLARFERLFEAGSARLERGDAAGARTLLREGLALWRGPALDDLSGEAFVRAPAARLEELRLAAVERRVDAELELGRSGELAAELEQLAAAHPLRERFVEQLMLALYRAGRQADALAAYRAHRKMLAAELGLEPGPSLRGLEAAILRQDVAPAAASPARAAGPPQPVVVAAASAGEPSRTLVELAAGAAADAIVVRLLPDGAELAAAAAALDEWRRAVGGPVRAAAFVAPAWVDGLLAFADAEGAALVLADVPVEAATVLAPPLPDLLLGSAADVGLVVRGSSTPAGDGPVLVVFGGGDHDWAALEVAAAAARRAGCRLGLVGVAARHAAGRDGSRELAHAALAVERAFELPSTPILSPPDPSALAAVVENGALVVAGIGSRWRSEGIGPLRAALVRSARSPVVLVHRGPRPGVLAPRESRTRFTWSLQN